MLQSLEIKNIAVIEKAIFEAGRGLNVITGETGAGKSLLIDSIGLILGSKASKELIRTGSSEAFVEAVFDYSDSPSKEYISSYLSENDIESDPDCQLIISRKITAEGKSTAKINGSTQILSKLKDLSFYLIDIHGQHDTQKIFDENSHITLLDSFGGQEVHSALIEYRDSLDTYKDLVLKIKSLSKNPDELNRQKKELQNAVNEISDASFEETEEEKLNHRAKELKINKLTGTLIDEMNQLINNEDSDGLSVCERLSSASKVAIKLASIDKSYESLSTSVSNLYLEIEGLSSDVSKLNSSIDFDPSEAERVRERIDLLNTLLDRYNCKNVSELNDYMEKSKTELMAMEDIDHMLSLLRKERSVAEAKVLAAGEKLTEIRKAKAETLSSMIEKELSDLEFNGAVFKVEFTRRDKSRFFSANGIDDVRFLFSANPGQEAKSLAKIASGGEASRIMLAIKTILSEADDTDTLIFDEIDSGVSGKAASGIASKLKVISKKHQVLCITHTAQVAAASDNGFMLSKEVENGNTITVVNRLYDEEKIVEVSRLLSGSISSESVDLAKQLISSFS